jgi:hypothetical protein
MYMDDEVVVLGANKRKAVFLLLASLVFVAAGISMVVSNPHAAIAWICIAFFGLGIPLSIYMLTPGAGELRIDRNGIEMKTLFKPMKLSWSDVNGFYVGRIRTGYTSTKMIGIEYSNSYQKLRAGRQLSAALTGMQGGIPNNFNRPAEQICELLNRAKKQWS